MNIKMVSSNLLLEPLIKIHQLVLKLIYVDPHGHKRPYMHEQITRGTVTKASIATVMYLLARTVLCIRLQISCFHFVIKKVALYQSQQEIIRFLVPNFEFHCLTIIVTDVAYNTPFHPTSINIT